jgi:hypothetical protein
MLFSVNPAIFMKVKVPMIDVGIASAAIKVTRSPDEQETTQQARGRRDQVQRCLERSRMKRD